MVLIASVSGHCFYFLTILLLTISLECYEEIQVSKAFVSSIEIIRYVENGSLRERRKQAIKREERKSKISIMKATTNSIAKISLVPK